MPYDFVVVMATDAALCVGMRASAFSTVRYVKSEHCCGLVVVRFCVACVLGLDGFNVVIINYCCSTKHCLLLNISHWMRSSESCFSMIRRCLLFYFSVSLRNFTTAQQAHIKKCVMGWFIQSRRNSFLLCTQKRSISNILSRRNNSES